ncbi:MAG: hypothetical protein WCF36_08040 [Candidatus Nanopelagicales bacterium]
MPVLTIREIYDIARAAGFGQNEAVTWTAIALAESDGRTDALSDGGERSVGLWQIDATSPGQSSRWGPLDDPRSNARAAYDISRQGSDMRPWTVTHDASRGTAADYRPYLAHVEREIGVSGDPRGVAGYGAALPPPLAPGAASTSYDQIDPGQDLGAGSSLWTSDGASRVDHALPGDADGDGLTDVFERLVGTDPTRADSDADGLADGFEAYVSGTDPLSIDTDHDGATDGFEVGQRADPLSQGIDGDAVPRWTVASGYQSRLAAAQARAATQPTPVAGPLADPQDSEPVVTPPALERSGLGSQTATAMHEATGIEAGDDGDHVHFGGKTVDRRTASMLTEAQRLANIEDPSIGKFDLTQGSFSHSVGASGGTHDGPGAFDMYTKGYSASQKDVIGMALRDVGFASWRRLESQGPWGEHWHGIAIGTKGLPSVAAGQVKSYLAGGNGLRGGAKDADPRPDQIMTWEQYLQAQGSLEADPGAAPAAGLPTTPSFSGDQFDIGTGQLLDAGRDSDGDGLTDAFEHLAGTGAARADTDGDGLTDGFEVGSSGTDPWAIDSDLDGFTDAAELRFGSDPLGTGALGSSPYDGSLAGGTLPDPDAVPSTPSPGDPELTGGGSLDL